jgi:hypothetical protein
MLDRTWLRYPACECAAHEGRRFAAAINGENGASMNESVPYLLWVIVTLCIVMGLAGTVLPAVPGTPLIFAGMFLAAWIDDFHRIGGWTLLVAGILTVVSMVMDFLATSLGARTAGASKYAILGAALGTLVGLFFFIPGLIIGPFVGAVAGEFYARRDLKQAGKAGVATWIGLLIGTAVKLAIGCAMIGLLILALVMT